MKPFIITLTGPSCAGKTTLEANLCNAGFASVVSTTTRPPRNGEQNGISYYFKSTDEFRKDLNDGRFVESVTFGDHQYGVSVDEIERVAKMGKPIVVIVEPHGQKQIRQFCDLHGWNLFSVFITNPANVIARRFLARLRDDLQGIKNHASVLRRYADRMAIMMGDETQWVEEAYRTLRYDRVLTRFGESDLAPVVCELMTEAQRNGYLTTAQLPDW